MKTVVVLGGYGNFGKRVVTALAEEAGIHLIIAGRCISKAHALVGSLRESAKATLAVWQVDIFSPEFERQLQQHMPFLVIHTGGPFQGQDYRVPQACIDVQAHYIDLADDRQFVCDISALNARAQTNGVLVVSGASSVPGLSSAVIEHFQSMFERINTIDIAIAPGNKAERGLATIAAILSYTGHPFQVFKGGHWQPAYGWMDAKVNDFGDIAKKRSLANVDVPDLLIFPERYKVSDRVSFQAGLELPLLHWGMVAMAYLTKHGLVRNWAPYAKSIRTLSEYLLPFGTDIGAMEVRIVGTCHDNSEKSAVWRLYAPSGQGPYIPTLSAIIIAKKLLAEECSERGAMPCVGLFKLSDFDTYFNTFGIYAKEEVIPC
ncbi:saccharopine dehydrogenase NADP-binding domain-containing protein [Pseudoalteromonas sp. SMS1]|uniref:saccharopine dehydrogenase family protein n=1 Tax=Pseudoalteromonas sp. SMS1 TaxID=2908894 RepID=UPI001F2EA45A|nr:saccharopine dehydrogenase NADP-binding domain-containing protein [Pseudoalteromonas sp. SMS1]MCF2856702.1 saccharopine dehydrogenase NADP-binding domain-containing protein [Pseudoalteromonas sp. SMS1]